MNTCICYSCKLDKKVSGCNKPIKDMKVVKGIGTVECKHYENIDDVNKTK